MSRCSYMDLNSGALCEKGAEILSLCPDHASLEIARFETSARERYAEAFALQRRARDLVSAQSKWLRSQEQAAGRPFVDFGITDLRFELPVPWARAGR